MLRDYLFKFQKAVREAKNTYLSNIIRAEVSNPKLLFSIINAFINPFNNMHQKSSLISCDEFLKNFSQKTADQHFQIPIVVMDPTDSPAYSAEWSKFQSIDAYITSNCTKPETYFL